MQIRKFFGAYYLILVMSFLLLPVLATAESDVQFTLDANGVIDYTLISVSTEELFDGELPANDPTMNLVVGTRYGVTNLNPSFHPFEVLAKGDGPNDDIILLSQDIEGSLEGDADINWVEDGQLVEFTVTPALVEAMNQDDNLPGYRCGNHVNTMRGDFEITEETDVTSWELY